MWTAEHWLSYTERRAATSLTNVAWSAATRQLSFGMAVPSGADPQSLALPRDYDNGTLTGVTIDGSSASLTQRTITGRQTSFVNVNAGTHTIVASYSSGPVTATPTSAATNTPTATPSNTPTATPNNTPTRTPTSTPLPGGPATHTTIADFGACAAATNTIVTRINDGEVRLAGVLGDEFSGTTLDSSQWTAGGWLGSNFTIAVNNSELSIAGTSGAYVRSNNSQAVTTLETSAQFNAAPWQHLGWGGLDFADNRYLLFSTFNSSTNLYARSNSGSGEQNTDLGPIPSGFHTYRIERTVQSATTDQISYYIDGTLRAQHTISTLPPLYVYISHGSLTSTPTLDVDRLWVYPAYVGSGSFQSCAIDAGTNVELDDRKLGRERGRRHFLAGADAHIAGWNELERLVGADRDERRFDHKPGRTLPAISPGAEQQQQ